jgi:hypothetical protein
MAASFGFAGEDLDDRSPRLESDFAEMDLDFTWDSWCEESVPWIEGDLEGRLALIRSSASDMVLVLFLDLKYLYTFWGGFLILGCGG